MSLRDAVRGREALMEVPNPNGDHGDWYRHTVAQLLGRLDPTKPMGTQLCDALMRLKPTMAFEALAFRQIHALPEVYLAKRGPNETAYPNQWHVPGSLYRAGERDRHVADRLQQEFGVGIRLFRFIDKVTHDEVRGTVHSMIFLVDLVSDPQVDANHGWFPINDMPADTISFHREPLIPIALAGLLSMPMR